MTINDKALFARDAVASKLDEYRHPYWLKSDFLAPNLIGDFGAAGMLTVNLDIKIASGSSLMHPKNRILLEDIYLLLGLQSHRDCASSRAGSEDTHRKAVIHTLSILDYFLIRADEFKLEEHGFAAVSGNQLRQLLIDIADQGEAYEWIYGWREHVDMFIESAADALTNAELTSVLEVAPQVGEITQEQEDAFSTKFEASQILRARAFLYNHHMYRRSSTSEYAYGPATSELAKVFYANTLRGVNGNIPWPIPIELSWSPHERYRREYPNASVEVEATDQGASEKNFEVYRRKLLTFEQLSKCGRGMSPSALAPIVIFNYRDALKLKPPGRTFTLPPDYVLRCMGRAVDFHREHADHLLKSYTNVLKAAKLSGKSLRKFVNENDIRRYCTRKTVKLGVTVFSLKSSIGVESHKRNRKNPTPRSSKADYFTRLRRCEGLLECIQVLFGAISLVIGTLMAGRDSEIENLPTADCLSESKRWLKLLTAKSGTPRLRRRDARPIPKIGADMVVSLQKFQSGCAAIGAEVNNRLFAIPERGHHTANSHAVLDVFIDFIDLPILPDGSRYYVRQHMLRRFFAVLFFFSAGLKGLESLRWMLRHLDMEHLYSYITASIPGGILRTIKSAAATLMVRAGAAEYLELGEYLRNHLGTSRFDVLSDGELAQYITSLQETGTIKIEPVFLDEMGRRRFHIGVQIWNRDEMKV